MKIMANAATIPAEGQILVNIENMSMLKDIKKAISLLKWVGKITVPRRRKLYSAYELSLRDLDEGRVYKYDSLDDLIKEIEGWATRPGTYLRHAQYGNALRFVQQEIQEVTTHPTI